MAEIVRVEGEEYKRRNPWGVWGLTLITVGIYGFVWYYKINNEARKYLRDQDIKPGIALLAIILGWLLIVPPFVSYYRTGERIGRMQERAGIQNNRIIPILALIAAFFVSLHTVYNQSELNKVWDAEKARAAAGSGTFDQAPEPQVPPPPPA
jgi:drug/metabolite transporter (DMT)-like permease